MIHKNTEIKITFMIHAKA